ncbi:MAG: rhodanese-like domain-containing protein [Fimbriimonas sp.]|nr:rhodanese-like domain-containing protein [Fimbriimonas sp.]
MSYQKFGAMLLVFLGIGLLLAKSTPVGTEAKGGGGGAILQIVQSKQDHVMPLDLAKAAIEGSKKYFVVDVRQPWEFDDYHIPGAVNIPLEQLMNEKARAELPKDKTIVLYSAGGTHAAQAWVVLAQEGYQVKSLLDGLQGWWRDVMTPTSLKIGDVTDESKDVLEYKGAKAMREYFQHGAAPSGSVAPPITTVPSSPTLPAPSTTSPTTPPSAKAKGGGC